MKVFDVSTIPLRGRITVVSSQCTCAWNLCSNSTSIGSNVIMNSRSVMESPYLMPEWIENPQESWLVMTHPCVASQTLRKSCETLKGREGGIKPCIHSNWAICERLGHMLFRISCSARTKSKVELRMVRSFSAARCVDLPEIKPVWCVGDICGRSSLILRANIRVKQLPIAPDQCYWAIWFREQRVLSWLQDRPDYRPCPGGWEWFQM